MNKVIVGAALTVLSFSLPASAMTTQKYQLKGQTADAYFYQSDECNYMSVGVFAADNVSKSGPGAPTPQKGAYVSYSTYNWCNGEGSYREGFSSDATFTADNGLKSATLNGTFTLMDYSSGNTTTANVALTWTGTGDTYRGNSHSHYQGPGYSSNYRYNGAYRQAQVSGSVTLDGKNIISNLVSYASLSSSNSGSVEVTRK